jgi:nuclear transport factor 2 (NTF2) superfamily protein
MISVPVSVGELIDKLSILHVKKIKISNEKKMSFINREYELLYDMSSFYLNNEEIIKLYNKLVEVNSNLWEVEDELRIFESKSIFDESFIILARKVYHTNDERFSLKNKINELTNSEIREQKDYVEYK